MQSETVSVNGVTLNARREGKAGAPWVVFSNSLLTDLSMWDDQVAALSARFQILRYDQRGHGGSQVPTQVCSFSDLAEDVVGLMDHYGIVEASFVGLSMGCATGLALAVRHPQRVTRLVLCDGPAQSPAGSPALWESRIAFARENGMPALVEATLQRWFRAETLESAPARIAQLRAVMQGTTVEGFVACASALMDFDFTGDLPRIDIPTVLIAGAADGALPAAMQAMAAAMPQAQFHEIAEAGHLPNIEQPQAFLGHLQDALGIG